MNVLLITVKLQYSTLTRVQYILSLLRKSTFFENWQNDFEVADRNNLLSRPPRNWWRFENRSNWSWRRYVDKEVRVKWVRSRPAFGVEPQFEQYPQGKNKTLLCRTYQDLDHFGSPSKEYKPGRVEPIRNWPLVSRYELLHPRKYKAQVYLQIQEQTVNEHLNIITIGVNHMVDSLTELG